MHHNGHVMRGSARQFGAFVAVGAASAVLDIGILQALLILGNNVMIATSAGFAAGLAANYALHTRFTFGSAFSPRIFAKFIAVVALNYTITVLLVWAFDEALSMPLLGKIISLPIVAINGFLLSKRMVFR